MEYTEPRYAKDPDVWVAIDGDNPDRVFAALARFGAPISDLSARDFSEPEIFYQIGVAPIRIDVLTSLSGLTFQEAWERKSIRAVDDIESPFISPHDLIAVKLAAGRRQDRADVASLRRALKRAAS